MRLFIALELPTSVRREIAAFGSRLEPRLPRARWVAAESLHLTLAFLGETAAELVAPLAGALDPVFARHPAPTLAVAGGGTFPPRRPARVAWLAVAADPELGELAAEVRAAAAAAVGGEPERRPFHAHVTVARPARPWPRRACEALAEEAARPFGEPFAVAEGALFASRLGANGARYRALERWPFAGGGR